jgi:SAM-dependent methyltransferase
MDAPAGHDANADQIAYWNGPGGQRWANRQAEQDVLLTPVLKILIDRAKARPGERVLDVGCGCGGTSVAFARQVAPSGFVLGVDISTPMLTYAREIAPRGLPLEFVLADATVHPFDPGTFDLLVSRFGVMFFADPALSFANMRRALRADGRVTFVCWREPRDNPWLTVSLQAVYQHVPKPPRPEPDEPGPFAFASEERVTRILRDAGYKDIAMEQSDLTLDIAIGQGLEAAVRSALEIGPASRALQGHPPEVFGAAKASVRELFAPLMRGDSLPLGGSIWIVTARS